MRSVSKAAESACWYLQCEKNKCGRTRWSRAELDLLMSLKAELIFLVYKTCRRSKKVEKHQSRWCRHQLEMASVPIQLFIEYISLGKDALWMSSYIRSQCESFTVTVYNPSLRIYLGKTFRLEANFLGNVSQVLFFFPCSLVKLIK